MSVWSVIVPGILLLRKLNDLNLANKTNWLVCPGNVELYLELGRALGMLVDCQQGPLFVRSSDCIHGDGRR